MTYSWPPGPEFWTGQFPANTAERTAPHLFKGIIPPTAADAGDVLVGLAALRQAYSADTAASAKVRVYVGEDRHDELVDTVLSAPAWDGDGPEQFVPWMQSLVDADRFSLVINNLETVNTKLATGLGLFLDSLFNGWGVPIGGAEQVAFAGNYAGTAFGVHEGYEDAFLVHLGPGVKNFYCWAGQDYRKLTGGADPLYGDYAWLLEHGQLFVLEPGDALFLPRRVFHVGTQKTFSVSVAVPLYTYPDTRLLRLSAFPTLLDAALSDGPENLGVPSSMHPAAAGSAAVASSLTDLARSTLQTVADRLEDAIAGHVSGRWNTIRSNGGWELVDHDLARDQAAAAFDPDRVAPGAQVRIPAPYRLLLPEPGRAFLRGIGVELDTGTLPADLVDKLNTGAVVTLPHETRVLQAVRSLGTTGGLELTAATTTKEHS